MAAPTGTTARARARLRTPLRSRQPPNPIAALLGFIWLVVVLIPIWYVILTSLRTQDAYESLNPLLPEGMLTLDNYRSVFEQGFFDYVKNSVLVTATAVLIATTAALLAGYAIVRARTAFTAIVFRIFLLGLAIPGTAVLIPLYFLVMTIHLYDTYWAIILPSAAFSLPVSVLIMTNFIRDVPRALFEAMVIDGASEPDLFLRLVLPLSRPAIVTVTLVNTLAAWNGFIFPLILTSGTQYSVLPLAVYNFEQLYSMNIPAVLATVVLSALPLALLYAVARRYLVQGLVAGYTK
jgi:raffinose/stachyose/melibiose transport system permease protein